MIRTGGGGEACEPSRKLDAGTAGGAGGVRGQGFRSKTVRLRFETQPRWGWGGGVVSAPRVETPERFNPGLADGIPLGFGKGRGSLHECYLRMKNYERRKIYDQVPRVRSG